MALTVLQFFGTLTRRNSYKTNPVLIPGITNIGPVIQEAIWGTQETFVALKKLIFLSETSLKWNTGVPFHCNWENSG
jgi:hypothetical protein